MLSAAATSDIHFMAVEDLLHPPPQSLSPYLSFTIHCTHDAMTIHFRKQKTKNKSDPDWPLLARTTRPAQWLQEDRLYRSAWRKCWLKCLCGFVYMMLLPGFLFLLLLYFGRSVMLVIFNLPWFQSSASFISTGWGLNPCHCLQICVHIEIEVFLLRPPVWKAPCRW